MSLFNSAVSFISQATNLGISFSAVRHVSELFDSGDEERISHFIKVVRGWCLLTALLGMFVCVVVGPFLSEYTFSWGDHTLHFVMLAPAVGLAAITGGEMAILKGARQLKSLAVIQIISIFLALLISVPLFYFFNQTAIVPVIVLMALFSLLLTIRFSYRLYPLQLTGMNGILGEGMEMVRLGMAFVLAGVLGSGAEILIRSYLNVTSNLDVVGLYNTGFMLTVTYAGMVFSAMETDYFPRLSAVGNDRVVMCEMVNKQIEVSFMIASPMLTALIVAMPIIVPLLFTNEFLPVVSMAQVAVFAMYIKSVSLPISYLTLAKGDSLAYLILEAVYDAILVAFIVLGYQYMGLYGTGLALTLSYLVDIIMLFIFAYYRYGYSLSTSVIHMVAIQMPIGISVYLTTFLDNAILRWGLGGMLCFASLAISLYILHQKTSLWNALLENIRSKFHRHG